MSADLSGETQARACKSNLSNSHGIEVSAAFSSAAVGHEA